MPDLVELVNKSPPLLSTFANAVELSICVLRPHFVANKTSWTSALSLLEKAFVNAATSYIITSSGQSLWAANTSVNHRLH
mmetsp:Transcript_30574/g.94570  ORF Transcript_30574/g.94570 Transcript_30574/m.94570 type:complete len:80 (+) Transcript_30574:220-459(+)